MPENLFALLPRVAPRVRDLDFERRVVRRRRDLFQRDHRIEPADQRAMNELLGRRRQRVG